jgi:hypothetical protein
MDGDKLAKITSKSIKDRETYYKRLKTRETKRMGITE